ncbi:hypothetical protein FG379_001289 [Cryptosporidium bovis]|uniref:uncharacterized protein n=1 Tax=Cryptosporidium bovis TaxID=310047 RepID=UPI00351AA5C3|nr:hypothetical protein FG379_001289 [Cryptosporidium bovis]
MVRLSIYQKNKENYHKKGGIKAHKRRSILNSGTNGIENCFPNEQGSNEKLSRKSVGIKDKIDQNKKYISDRLSNQLSNESLNQLCNQCLNLLRQNKISSKNAFEIVLIDHLNDIVNVNSDESFDSDYSQNIDKINNETKNVGTNRTNLRNGNSTHLLVDKNKDSESSVGEDNFQKFQRAAVTLEASARIYGYRVDSTFDNAYRILSNIKSGQALSKNIDTDMNEDQDENEIDLNEESKDGNKKISKKVNFDLNCNDKTNRTLVSNRDSITIKNFDKCRDITCKPYFVKLLESEIRLNRTRYGMEEIGNIGSMSSTMMNNLDLNQTININEDTNNHYVSLKYNVSGDKMITNNQSDYSNYCKSLKYPLKVNKKTLELLLSPLDNDFKEGDDNFRICPEIDKIIDSIQYISNEDNIKNQTKELIEFKCYEKPFDLKIQDSNQSIVIDTAEDQELNAKNNDVLNSDCDEQNIDNHFQEYIENIYNDSEVNLKLFSNQENNIYEIKNNEKTHFNIGEVLDYLIKNSKTNKITNERKKRNVTKLNSKENNISKINIDDFIKTGNNGFNGIEWVKSLPKNTTNNLSLGPKKKQKNSTVCFSGSGGKVFVNHENKTSSIFNYNQNHLFCLANISNTKVNFEYLHKSNNDENIDQNNYFVENTNICVENNANECFSHVNNQNNPYSQQDNANFDLMNNHNEIEEFISEANSGGDCNISNYDNIEKKHIIVPTNNFNVSSLLERSSKTITIINEQNAFSQKFGKFSNYVDIDFIKENIKKSIEILNSNNNTLSLYNIIKTTRTLISETSISVSPGIFFICVLHICNEERYSLSYLNNSNYPERISELEDHVADESSLDIILEKEED